MAPASSRGGGRGGLGRGKGLKFQPKSSARRSKEEREADEKEEQAKAKADAAAAEREKQRMERRNQRGRGSGGGRERGGGARGGVSGWMSAGGGGGGREQTIGHLTGASLGPVSRGSRPVGPSSGGGGGGGVGISGGSSKSSGVGTSSSTKHEGRGPVRSREDMMDDVVVTSSGTRPRKAINIEYINLVSYDEGEGDQKDGEHEKKVRVGLPPVRLARHEHIHRRMKVNIDLDSLPAEDREEAKAVAAVSGESTVAEPVPIKTEDGSAPGLEAKIKIEPEAKKEHQARRTRGQASATIPAAPATVGVDEKAPAIQKRAPQQGVPLGAVAGIETMDRPLYVREDCNFVTSPRPPGWDSKEDAANWERNQKKMYAVYEELSFPERMNKGGTEPDVEPKISAAKGTNWVGKEAKPGDADVEMRDAEQPKPDRKQDLVYLFQIPPGIPGLEGLRIKDQDPPLRDKEVDVEEVMIVEPSSTASGDRSQSPGASRKPKGKQPAETKIKDDPEGKVESVESIPLASSSDAQPPPGSSSSKNSAAPPATTASASVEERPGYIGDLVVYSTGQARLDWGGLPLNLKLGLQSNMLQQVLLTSAPVTRETALAAAAAADDARRTGVKKEPGTDAGAAAAAVDAEGEGADAGNAYAMGSIAGSFNAVPDFKALFGDKWKYNY